VTTGAAGWVQDQHGKRTPSASEGQQEGEPEEDQRNEQRGLRGSAKRKAGRLYAQGSRRTPTVGRREPGTVAGREEKGCLGRRNGGEGWQSEARGRRGLSRELAVERAGLGDQPSVKASSRRQRTARRRTKESESGPRKGLINRREPAQGGRSHPEGPLWCCCPVWTRVDEHTALPLASHDQREQRHIPVSSTSSTSAPTLRVTWSRFTISSGSRGR
jgi:hypothetical protein